MKCTCKVKHDYSLNRTAEIVNSSIKQCPLCETAPALLQFSEDTADEVDTHGFILQPEVFVREIKILIAKAKGEAKC